jgi:hypothetical protein
MGSVPRDYRRSVLCICGVVAGLARQISGAAGRSESSIERDGESISLPGAASVDIRVADDPEISGVCSASGGRMGQNAPSTISP